jgi:hypothetical protein
MGEDQQQDAQQDKPQEPPLAGMQQAEGIPAEAAPAVVGPGTGRGEDTALRWGGLPDTARQQVLEARLRAWAQLSAEE